MDGRLLNLNQGEFYVYSPDGVFDGIDTIKVEGGRFTLETQCKESGTLVIVFPNFSEVPVFAEPGKSVSVKGDASHLKEIEIEGTKENELMTAFRQQLVKASPPEEMSYAENFVKNNPATAASVYVLKKYFILVPDVNLDKAASLADIVYKAQPKNGEVARIVRYVKMMKTMRVEPEYRRSLHRISTERIFPLHIFRVKLPLSIHGQSGAMKAETCATGCLD